MEEIDATMQSLEPAIGIATWLAYIHTCYPIIKIFIMGKGKDVHIT